MIGREPGALSEVALVFINGELPCFLKYVFAVVKQPDQLVPLNLRFKLTRVTGEPFSRWAGLRSLGSEHRDT
jgi:hypothetical protein